LWILHPIIRQKKAQFVKALLMLPYSPSLLCKHPCPESQRPDPNAVYIFINASDSLWIALKTNSVLAMNTNHDLWQCYFLSMNISLFFLFFHHLLLLRLFHSFNKDLLSASLCHSVCESFEDQHQTN
jgi:hypothetical protein